MSITNQPKQLDVPIELVDDNPFNARMIYDTEIVARRAREIKAHGQLVSAVAVRSTRQPGRYTLIDGHYRKQGLLAAGKATIRLDIRTVLSDVELFHLSFSLNANRTPQSALDNALAWRRILDQDLIKSQNELVYLTSMSKQSISKTLAILDLPPSVLSLMHQAPRRFSLRLSYELVLIARAGGTTEVTELAERAVKEQIPVRDLTRILLRLRTNQPPRKVRETSRQYPLGVQGSRGILKTWPSGRLVLDVVASGQDQQKQLVDYLCTQFPQ